MRFSDFSTPAKIGIGVVGCFFTLCAGFGFLVILVGIGVLSTSPAVQKTPEVKQPPKPIAKKTTVPTPTPHKEIVRKPTATPNTTLTSPLNRTKATGTPSATFTVDQICDIAKENAIAAEERFKGRSLAVKGEVVTVVKGILGEPIVGLTGSTVSNVVQCYFSEEDKPVLARLKPGHNVLIQGKYGGFTMSVVLEGCRLLKIQ